MIATPSAVGSLRRRTVEFAAAAGASAEMTQAIELAVSEAVTNAVLHAYAGREPGEVRVGCEVSGGDILVEVYDDGAGVAPRPDSPGLGHGLAIVGGLVRSLEIAERTDGPGTVVRMTFGEPAAEHEIPSLEPLCALALECLADASCVDVVGDGVLRRAAADVAGDPALASWLRGALPPAKPGTATWAAMREGGARLVVHDPLIPRSPGGPGEKLGLTWWLSVPLDGALWGLGGREAGRPVPSEGVIRALTEAARTDLTRHAQRAALRARLAYA